MENTDSYLHKKFKKQLSVTPKVQNDKENKDTPRTEQSEEKTIEITRPQETAFDPRIVYRQTPTEYNQTLEKQILDNNDSVPNQSTNSSTVKSNFSKSSISLENQQSSNSYISHVVSNQPEHLAASFDTKFREQTNYTVSPSSILDSVYSRQDYANEDMYVNYNNTDECPQRAEDSPDLEAPPPPDKNANGKYVCPYCNLVCSKPSVLQKHIRAHTNERPFPCTSCGFSFKTRSNLYKHCRSRTHANRVMGTKNQEPGLDSDCPKAESYVTNSSESNDEQTSIQKPYKPRFHTAQQFFDNVAKENIEEERTQSSNQSSDLSYHINEIINKNHSIVNPNGTFQQDLVEHVYADQQRSIDEPLNLTNKNRKRSLSEVTEPVVQKSLIKELLLKNLSASDMQCPHCKMIFRTVTELDVHKYRGNCKAKSLGAKYTRSSSVNVASILTQNKNAFDNIPQLQNTVFPLNSPGPFLGKTRLVDGDKNKSFSFDAGNLPLLSPSEPSPNYLLSPSPFDREKKPGNKLFGGEVKVQGAGESKSFKIDSKDEKYDSEPRYNVEYGDKISENRVVKSSLLQSGGTVLTNKTNYNKQNLKTPQEVIRVFETNTASPSIEISNLGKKFTFDRPLQMQERREEPQHRLGESSDFRSQYPDESSPLYKNIMDFSQTVLRKLTPNLRQPTFTLANVPVPRNTLINPLEKSAAKLAICKPRSSLEITLSPLPETGAKKNFYESKPSTPTNLYNPVNLIVNGKVVRHVPGIPGPVVADSPVDMANSSNIVAVVRPIQQNLLPLPPLVIDRVPVTSRLSESCSDKILVSQNVFLQPEKLPDRTVKSPNLAQVDKVSPRSSVNFLQPEKVAERVNKSPKPDLAESKPELLSKPPELKFITRFTDTKPLENNKTSEVELRKFARPSSLALKPTVAFSKQHHGLTPTMFNQILISPDTPRVAKKYAEHLIQGNYFSYLGLKSSTKPIYCTLNKTQPFYVPHFKKLSMYSEWRQQDTRQDKLYVSNYDSRQKSGRYTIAGKSKADLMTHSSYKFMVCETSHGSDKDDEPQKNTALLGGYESNEDYTYIRGRGRGRYVCDQCGIRCKKPSMLKKHIRTHSNDRPYTCSHCNFSFKTKGNLTKHMKSKAHSKNSTASSGSSSSTQLSAHSSDSDTDDSGMDSSDESTRQQEHEAAYGLLSLSQKPAGSGNSDMAHLRSVSPNELFMSSEEIAHVSQANYARNKILDERNCGFDSRKLNEVSTTVSGEEASHARDVRHFLGTARPLTYPYSIASPERQLLASPKPTDGEMNISESVSASPEPKSIKQFHVIQKYMPVLSPKLPEPEPVKETPRKVEVIQVLPEKVLLNNMKNMSSNVARALPTLKINDVMVTSESTSDLRKRKFSALEDAYKHKIPKNDEVMDLSMTTSQDKTLNGTEDRILGPKNVTNEIYNALHKVIIASPQRPDAMEDKDESSILTTVETIPNNGTVLILRPLQAEDPANEQQNSSDDQGKVSDYDNSAMETLADIATKQVKLEKNTLAKSVATEYLKLATKNENIDGSRESVNYASVSKDVNDIIAKSEGNKSCTICAKSFNKPSQLRLHMNIHYLERPFRCESCSVSFRTKGHLQKHERSAGHNNKLSSSPTLSSSEPRPFKCIDCSIAFRIHGHLAKHLRSKLHIMKLECLAKIPFGLYAELERSNSLLTEINTCDGDQCLESLKILAKKVFINDQSKLNYVEIRDNINAE